MLNIIDTVITNPTDCLAAPYKVLKKGPGGDLIRMDLIRFPGSIPGAR